MITVQTFAAFFKDEATRDKAVAASSKEPGFDVSIAFIGNLSPKLDGRWTTPRPVIIFNSRGPVASDAPLFFMSHGASAYLQL